MSDVLRIDGEALLDAMEFANTKIGMDKAYDRGDNSRTTDRSVQANADIINQTNTLNNKDAAKQADQEGKKSQTAEQKPQAKDVQDRDQLAKQHDAGAKGKVVSENLSQLESKGRVAYEAAKVASEQVRQQFINGEVKTPQQIAQKVAQNVVDVPKGRPEVKNQIVDGAIKSKAKDKADKAKEKETILETTNEKEVKENSLEKGKVSQLIAAGEGSKEKTADEIKKAKQEKLEALDPNKAGKKSLKALEKAVSGVGAKTGESSSKEEFTVSADNTEVDKLEDVKDAKVYNEQDDARDNNRILAKRYANVEKDLKTALDKLSDVSGFVQKWIEAWKDRVDPEYHQEMSSKTLKNVYGLGYKA